MTPSYHFQAGNALGLLPFRGLFLLRSASSSSPLVYPLDVHPTDRAPPAAKRGTRGRNRNHSLGWQFCAFAPSGSNFAEIGRCIASGLVIRRRPSPLGLSPPHGLTLANSEAETSRPPRFENLPTVTGPKAPGVSRSNHPRKRLPLTRIASHHKVLCHHRTICFARRSKQRPPAHADNPGRTPYDGNRTCSLTASPKIRAPLSRKVPDQSRYLLKGTGTQTGQPVWHSL